MQSSGEKVATMRARQDTQVVIMAMHLALPALHFMVPL